MQASNRDGTPEIVVQQESAANDTLIGQTIAGNFRILKRIGSGAMGTVYKAEQISLGKMVALKVMRSELMADPKLMKRFELEARAASALSHPNTIQILDFGRDGDHLYIAMELLTGTDLSQVVLRDGPLPLERTARIVDQVLAALDEAHEAGIVHRDLKPANIMLVNRRGETDFVKVCDFGIAKSQGGRDRPMLTMTGIVFGTPEYMSPEQARGDVVDCRADLYAVAVILYQLVTGQLPFPAGSAAEILAKHIAELPPPPSSHGDIAIPDALEALILRGLAKKPEHRPATAAMFRDELRASLVGIVDHWPGQSTPPASIPPRSGPVRRSGPRSAVTGTPGAPLVTPTVRVSRGGIWIWVLGAAAVASAAGAYFALRGSTVLPGGGTEEVARTPELLPAAPAPTPPVAATPKAEVATPARTAAAVEEQPQTAPAPADQADKPVVGSRPAARDVRPAARAHVVVDKRGRRTSVPEPAPRVAPRRDSEPVHSGRSDASAPVAVAAAPAPAAEPAPVVAPPPVAAAPAAGPGEVMREAERLLGQGEVATACKRGEEVRRMNPKLAAVHKFLGKCYMRAGKPQPAKESYQRYLELAPDAADAAFIKSFTK